MCFSPVKDTLILIPARILSAFRLSRTTQAETSVPWLRRDNQIPLFLVSQSPEDAPPRINSGPDRACRLFSSFPSESDLSMFRPVICDWFSSCHITFWQNEPLSPLLSTASPSSAVPVLSSQYTESRWLLEDVKVLGLFLDRHIGVTIMSTVGIPSYWVHFGVSIGKPTPLPLPGASTNPFYYQMQALNASALTQQCQIDTLRAETIQEAQENQWTVTQRLLSSVTAMALVSDTKVDLHSVENEMTTLNEQRLLDQDKVNERPDAEPAIWSG
ncbi:hypothetical protein OG21DRAFT_1501844, partial [Imleria badia]